MSCLSTSDSCRPHTKASLPLYAHYPQMFYLLSSKFFDKTFHLIKIPREYSISFFNHIYPWYLYEIKDKGNHLLYWNNHTSSLYFTLEVII